MNNLEIEKLKNKVVKFIQEVSNIKDEVNSLIDEFSIKQEFMLVEEKIRLLRELSAALTLESSIEDFLKIDDLMEELYRMVFDLDYVIDGDLPEYILPTIESLSAKVSEGVITVKAEGVSDPQGHLKKVVYGLYNLQDALIQESGELSPVEEFAFDDGLESGTYYVKGIFTYAGESSEETFEMRSSNIIIEEKEDVIIPTIGNIAIEVISNRNVAVEATGVTDPQGRLIGVDYSLFDNSDTLIEFKEGQDCNAKIHFDTDLAQGSYIVLGEFSYQDSDGVKFISKNSLPFNIEGEESGEYVASINLTASSKWQTGFTGNLEVTSHSTEDFGGDWELTFETKLTSLAQWQITSSIASGVMKIVSGMDWEGKPYFTLPPEGGFVVSGLNANGAPFDMEVIKNARLNGQKVKIYIDGEPVEDEDEIQFPENNPIYGSVPVGTLLISENEEYLIGNISIPESDLYGRYAIYHNNSKVREEDIIFSRGEGTVVNIQIPMSSLPIKYGSNKISLAFSSMEGTFYESNEVEHVVEAPELPEKSLVGYWSSWGGNGPTSYVDLEDIPSEYSTVVVSFIEHEADNVTPKFDPTASGQVTDQEFMDKVKILQNRGVKVLIAIGGQNGVFRLNSAADKEKFKSGVIGIIERYGFDGYDIDLEGGSIGGSADYTLMVGATREIVEHFRTSNPDFVYSMAPEVAYLITAGFGDFYIRLIKEQKDIITYIHPQYYNAPGTGVFRMDGGGMVETSNNPSTQGEFITEFTHALTLGHDGPGWGQDPAQTFPIGPIPGEKLVIGLPAGTGAAGTGAIDDMEAIRTAWNNIIGRGILGVKGFMTWSIDWDKYHNWQFKNMVTDIDN